MTDTQPRAPLQVPCPTCKRPSLYSAANVWRPFCSERCRRADLGAWASEQFRVVAPTSAESPEDEASLSAPPAPPPPPRGQN